MITEREYCSFTDISHRKKYAQFFTPETIAAFMVSWVMEGIDKWGEILEPAIGLGIFSRFILEKNPGISITGYDIDNHIAKIAEDNFSDNKSVNLNVQDYLITDWEKRYDGIICNPPYMKFHDYDNNTVIPIVNEHLNINLTGFTNIYTLFLLKAISQLNKGGRCAFITPSEFLNADYGVEVKRHILTSGMNIHFVIIDFEENIFEGAMTTACITLIENTPSNNNIKFSVIKNISELPEALTHYSKIAISDLNPEEKWKKYYQAGKSKKYRNLTDFSNYAKVSRGIATGCNEYFVFNMSKASALDIPQEALMKCICHCPDIKKSIFSEEDFQKLSQKDKAVYLFKGQGNESMPEVRDYLRLGEANGVPDKYLCSKRHPWYAIERRVPAPIWVAVFSRKKLKFVRNEAYVSNLTTFHCLYLTNMFIDIDVFFAYLLTDIAHQVLLENARQYGNGLTKFEPNDINKAKIADFSILTDAQLSAIKDLYAQYRAHEDVAIIDKINDIFVEVYCNPDLQDGKKE